MIYISKDAKDRDVINIHRGDDGALTIPLKDRETKQPYTLHETEYIIFSVRERPDESSPLLLEAETEPGSNVVVFTHEATVAMEVGEYSADAQLMTRDGLRDTVWPELKGKDRTSKENRKNFCVMPEVTYR